MKQAGQSSTPPTNVQRAASFFQQPIWSRLLEAIYAKYIERGRVGGQVVLHSCDVQEQREIARFLKKRLTLDETLVVRLSDFQRALNESGFPCALADLLVTLYPARSHVTRPQARELRASVQQRFYEDLSALAHDLPAETKGRRWLLSGAHGCDYLFRRYKSEDTAMRETIVHAARTVVDALDLLPTPPAYERLSVFAQRIGGDPHCLDLQSLTGRLFLHALEDLATLDLSQSTEQTRGEGDVKDLEDSDLTIANHFDTSEKAMLWREYHHQRHLLYYEAGLLTDTISSSVAVFQLAHAEDLAGQFDPFIESVGSRVLVLPLRQLLAWRKLVPTSKSVYVFENPQVFEEVVDRLQQRASSGNVKAQENIPTLICTAGWPSVAAIQLLNLLIETSPDIMLHYSGDFDLPGLRIAAYLQRRYPANCRFWHLDPPSYIAALHHKSASFGANDLTALQTLPAPFASLVAAMQEKGQKAYQEGISHLLLQDIAHLIDAGDVSHFSHEGKL